MYIRRFAITIRQLHYRNIERVNIRRILTYQGMNFKTRLSYNNKISFLYDNGEVKHTNYTEISFYGDSYILAKTSDAVFYTLLDLNGNLIDNSLHIVHRFQNGLLLTYDFHAKEYVSSDKCRYTVNYNVYNVYNADTRRSYNVSIIQSDNLLTKQSRKSLQSKPSKITIKHFLNKPIYKFDDLIFTEIFDNQYIIAGTILNLVSTSDNNDRNVFDTYCNRKIWSVIDIFEQKEYDCETEIRRAYILNVAFEDANMALSTLVLMPEEPVAEDYPCGELFNDASSEFHMYLTWKKKSRWHQMISGLLSINNN